MWWHKLVREWTKTDYAAFSAYSWVLVFAVLTVMRLIQTQSPDLVFTAVFAVAMIPVELIIVVVFQKYSANTKALAMYPALLPNNFNEDKLLRDENVWSFSIQNGVPTAVSHSVF